MKAMSLRISMATLSPCLTPSFCNPLAMRSARSATSSWLRLRWPLMTPWKRDEVDIVSFRSAVGYGMTADLPRLRKPRRALLHVGADGLGLVGAAQQLLLLDGFGKQRRTGIDRQTVEHPLGGADCVRALAGDFARNLKSRGAGIVADPRS